MGITDKCSLNKTTINNNIALKHYPWLEKYQKCFNSRVLSETCHENGNYRTLSHYVKKGLRGSKS